MSSYTETDIASRQPALGRRRLARYFAAFLIPGIVTAMAFFAAYAFLRHTGEFMGPKEAAQFQESQDALYGSALEFRPYAYKLERYRLTRPEILIVGSSRVLAFPGQAFGISVLNAGNASNSLAQARAFIEDATAIAKPRAILLGVDFWWFNPARDEESLAAQNDPDVDVTLNRLFAPYRWLFEGSLPVSVFLNGALSARNLPPGIGVFAKLNGHGWDRFGRLDYGDLLTGGSPSRDPRFFRTIRRFSTAEADSKMYIGAMPSTAALANLDDLIADLRRQGIEIEILLAPFPRRVLTALAFEDSDNLVSRVQRHIRSLDVPIYDFTDPMILGSDDCEFVDGLHGGEVTYLRILDRIADGEGILARSINRDWVRTEILANAGYARIRDLRPKTAAPEIDFLDLGCPK